MRRSLLTLRPSNGEGWIWERINNSVWWLEVLRITSRVALVGENDRYYRNRFPLECYYQRCEEPIIRGPFVSKAVGRRSTSSHYYHVKCAEILHIV